ncbi:MULTISPECIES: tyrosine recombinase XerC [unclassified Ruminococcus]|uniref:tyrosine recombinase XerC n=1 Tax=unclassified Ruminococcus TaxID=2608920 RepID=UPI00210E88AC|nr:MULTISPECIES: tyrosine recombinase XerC [unclassified Ruminococcus]MCQ4022049.1 tyrosine-type recombinase/integrase [Ruminococcus sp. zg-924]MCQ4114369.1 tyrosine-type recombinase/integrase [Ruminococcus sp. zg-921]
MNSKYIFEAPDVIKDFLGYLQNIKGKSQKTVDEYYLDLRTFFRYIKILKGREKPDAEFDKIQISDIDIDLIKTVTLTDIYSFMDYAITDRQNNAKTRSRKTSSIKSFFSYITNKKCLLSINPAEELEVPKTKKSLPKYLTLEQSIELLQSVDGRYKERDYCILTLFLNCGLRLSELVGLNISDINLTDNIMTVTGKGNKQRIVYLNDSCVSALKNYIAVRPNDTKDKHALFISQIKRRMGNQAVQDVVYKSLQKIGLDGNGYSAHKLRHTAATLMYQHGNVDIRVLQEMLGHENLGTTEIYTHLSSEQLEKAAESNPLSKVKIRNKDVNGVDEIE